MRKLRHRGSHEDASRHSQPAGKAGFEPRSPDSRSGKQRGGRFDLPKLLSNNVPPGREERRGAAPRPPRPAGGRRRNSSGWLVLMLEECLEKSGLSPLYLTHHLPVSRSVREELP